MYGWIACQRRGTATQQCQPFGQQRSPSKSVEKNVSNLCHGAPLLHPAALLAFPMESHQPTPAFAGQTPHHPEGCQESLLGLGPHHYWQPVHAVPGLGPLFAAALQAGGDPSLSVTTLPLGVRSLLRLAAQTATALGRWCPRSISTLRSCHTAEAHENGAEDWRQRLHQKTDCKELPSLPD